MYRYYFNITRYFLGKSIDAPWSNKHQRGRQRAEGRLVLPFLAALLVARVVPPPLVVLLPRHLAW